MIRAKLAELASGEPLGYLEDEDPALRRLAVSSLASRTAEPQVRRALLHRLRHDPDEQVRAEAAEVLGSCGPAALEGLLVARSDPSATVVEAVATALGEVGDPQTVPWLLETATGHPESLVREAAVAALGAIGDPVALPTLLGLAREGRPQVRRRAVVALTAFDGPEVEPALLAARLDRNPMVREAAEMVVGRT
ncbi:MAG: HEAT repeat domain-containing protein [Actinomycetota bacterium]|nr:HEAT repeat domain-containing protein [Actinomycetota bacterium]